MARSFLAPLAAMICTLSGCSAPGEDTRQIEEQPATSGTRSAYTKPDDEVLKSTLSPLEYRVTQRDGTEPPYRNAYWDNKEPGLYVDVVSGEPLFSSTDKYKSGTGWPSFTKPVDASRIIQKEDRRLGMRRIEVRSRDGDSHLGHLFADGPKPTGLRYCINSASLRFIPVDELEVEGYVEYAYLFE